MEFERYINAELIVLIPVVYIIGVGLKKSRLADKWIPALLGGAAILMSAVWVLASGEIAGWQDVLLKLFTAVVQGVLIAGASVYANQLVKQAGKEE